MNSVIGYSLSVGRGHGLDLIQSLRGFFWPSYDLANTSSWHPEIVIKIKMEEVHPEQEKVKPSHYYVRRRTVHFVWSHTLEEQCSLFD